MSKELKEYIKYFVKQNRRALLIIFFMFFLAIALNPILQNNQFFKQKEVYSLDQYYDIWKYLSIAGFIASFLIGIYQFRFLYRKQMNDIFFSLPMKRSKLFLLQYLSGLAIIILPMLINYVLAIMACLIKGDSSFFPEFILVFIIIMVFVIVQYTFIVMVCCVCNHLLDAFIVNGAFVVFVYLFSMAMNSFLINQVRQLLGSMAFQTFNFTDQILSLISIPYSIWQFFINGLNYEVTKKAVYFYNTSSWTIIYWAILGIVFFMIAKKCFVKRSVEQAEQKTTAFITYPLIIIIFTFSLLLNIINLEWSDMIIPLILACIVYCGVIFLAQRKIKLRLQHVVLLILLLGISYASGYVFQITNGFGLVHEIPEPKEIHDGNVSFIFYNDEFIPSIVKEKHPNKGNKEVNDVTFYTEDKEFLETITSLQKVMMENKTKDSDHIDYFTNTNPGEFLVNITYYDHDGCTMRRGYIVKTNEEVQNTLDKIFIKYQDEIFNNDR